MKRVLFLCTHSSARSQMAERLLRAMAGDRFQAFSAGTEVTRVHPLVIAAMSEHGIDSTRQPKPALSSTTPRDACIGVFQILPRLKARKRERLVTFREVLTQIKARLAQFLTDAPSQQGAG